MNAPRTAPRRPSARQVAAAAAVVEWYLNLYYGTDSDPGVPAMFWDRRLVGSFAVTQEGFRAGRPETLFSVLVMTAMFQRRQDQQVLRILRGISTSDARELRSSRRLLALVDKSACVHLKQQAELLGTCDLAKDPRTRLGTCSAHSRYPCHLKRHTVLLKRYGHFGKVPTSLALMAREKGRGDLSGLRRQVFKETSDPAQRAQLLEARLSSAWRVNQKISGMFLSTVCNPDLGPERAAPWSRGVEWTYFVAIDSNVDRFLVLIGYQGPWTYEARRGFLFGLASHIPLSKFDRRLADYNPRVVQQALYLFMSEPNRRASGFDCSEVEGACERCDRTLRRQCPLSRSPGTRSPRR